MNADTCVSYCDMTSMDSYYSPSAPARDHQTNPFRTFSGTENKYSPTFLSGAKGPAYGEKSRSPFQPECAALDGAEDGTFNKYQLFMQRPGCKTPPEGGKLHADSAHNGTLMPCYGECAPGDCKSKVSERICGDKFIKSCGLRLLSWGRAKTDNSC